MHSTKVRHATNRELDYSGKGILQYRVLGAPVGLPVALASRVIILSSRSATWADAYSEQKLFRKTDKPVSFCKNSKYGPYSCTP